MTPASPKPKDYDERIYRKGHPPHRVRNALILIDNDDNPRHVGFIDPPRNVCRSHWTTTLGEKFQHAPEGGGSAAA